MKKDKRMRAFSSVFLLKILIPSVIITVAFLYWFLSFPPQYATEESKPHLLLQRFLLHAASRRSFERWLGSRLDSLNRRIPYWLPIWFINQPSGSIDGRLPPISEIDKDAHYVLPLLEDLKEHKFFRIFKVSFPTSFLIHRFYNLFMHVYMFYNL